MNFSVNTLEYSDHGGCNCGITHIYNFVTPGFLEKKDERTLLQYINDTLEDSYGFNGDYLVEATLCHGQFFKLEPILKEAGFKCVTSFTNGNSGNKVRVYHLIHTLTNKRCTYDEYESGEYDEEYDY